MVNPSTCGLLSLRHRLLFAHIYGPYPARVLRRIRRAEGQSIHYRALAIMIGEPEPDQYICERTAPAVQWPPVQPREAKPW